MLIQSIYQVTQKIARKRGFVSKYRLLPVSISLTLYDPTYLLVVEMFVMVRMLCVVSSKLE